MAFRRLDAGQKAARQTVQTAFKELERIISVADVRDFGLEDATLQDVQKAALDIENQLAARSVMRNMRRLSPLFEGLAYYSKSIEVICNGTPFLPWIWSPISLILKVGACSISPVSREFMMNHN